MKCRKKKREPEKRRNFRVLVQGGDAKDDVVVEMLAYTKDEAEMDAADKYRGKYVRAL